ITVRILDASAMPPAGVLLLPELAIFDDEVCYELATGPRLGAAETPYFVKTLLAPISAQVVRRKGSGELVAQGAVAPPGDGGGGGEGGLAEDGLVGAAVESGGDRVGLGDDLAGGVEGGALKGGGGHRGVAG